MNKLQPGQEKTVDLHRADGSHLLTVLISVFAQHVSFTFAGHQNLNRALLTAEARLYMRFLLDEAKAGTPLYHLVQRAGDFTSAMAIADQAEQDLIAGINADLNMTEADRNTAATQLTTDAREIVADGQGWNAYRQASTRRAAITTEPQDRVLAQADHNGYIRRGKTATIRQLIALDRMGLVKLDRRKQGRHWVTYGATLTAKAEKLAVAA